MSKLNNTIDETKRDISSQIAKFHKKFMYVILCNVIIWITMLVLFFINK